MKINLGKDTYKQLRFDFCGVSFLDIEHVLTSNAIVRSLAEMDCRRTLVVVSWSTVHSQYGERRQCDEHVDNDILLVLLQFISR
jgi:O-acetylhomoserine/O-acetylserine sulfhydrylase-like pyridoxal-dependent enzyme